MPFLVPLALMHLLTPWALTEAHPMMVRGAQVVPVHSLPFLTSWALPFLAPWALDALPMMVHDAQVVPGRAADNVPASWVSIHSVGTNIGSGARARCRAQDTEHKAQARDRKGAWEHGAMGVRGHGKWCQGALQSTGHRAQGTGT